MGTRNIVFTWNNYTEETLQRLQNLGWAYLCYGKEVGEQGTPHLQGYAEYTKVQRLTSLYKKWKGAHLETRRGTQEQAIKYTQKGGDWVEFGEKKQQGARTDLDNVREQALEGGMKSIVGWANLQQLRCAEYCLRYLEPERNWIPEVLWVWGPTGAGKSRWAHWVLPHAYTKNDGTKWWDGYDGHEDVIIDDFRDSWWSFTEMLSLLDAYGKRVECKGGSRSFVPKRVIITCAYPPNECYSGCKEDLKQLIRRITDSLHLVGDNPIEEPLVDAVQI